MPVCTLQLNTCIHVHVYVHIHAYFTITNKHLCKKNFASHNYLKHHSMVSGHPRLGKVMHEHLENLSLHVALKPLSLSFHTTNTYKHTYPNYRLYSPPETLFSFAFCPVVLEVSHALVEVTRHTSACPSGHTPFLKSAHLHQLPAPSGWLLVYPLLQSELPAYSSLPIWNMKHVQYRHRYMYK